MYVQTRFTIEEMHRLNQTDQDCEQWLKARSLVPYAQRVFTNLGVEEARYGDFYYYRCGEKLCKVARADIVNHYNGSLEAIKRYQLTSIELGDFFLHDS